VHPMTSDQNDERRIYDETVPDLGHAVRFFRRHWIALAGGCALGGVLALIGAWFLTRPVYRASATLLVSTIASPAATEGEELSMEGYQKVLESDAVVREAERRLAAEGVIRPGQGLRVGGNISSRIFASERRAAVAVAPLLEARARSSDPESAARIANTWAQVFIEKSGELVAGDVDAALEFLSEQESALRSRLEGLRIQKLTLAEQHRKEIESAAERWARARAEVAARWDREVLAMRQETEDPVVEHQAETRRLFDALAEEQGLAADGPASNRLLLELRETRIQLAQTPRTLALAGGGLEDTELSDRQGSASGRWASRESVRGEGSDLGIGSRELHPIYTQLALHAAALERELVGSGQADAGRRSQISSALEALQRERSASLVKLLADQGLALSGLYRSRQLELERLERRRVQAVDELEDAWRAAVEPIERESLEVIGQATGLASEYNAIELSKEARRLAKVQTVAAATPPLDPLPRQWVGKLILGLVAGALVGLGAALAREFTAA
jgi:uncharacterized protein involved in exopolysaccharide biosynthesis